MSFNPTALRPLLLASGLAGLMTFAPLSANAADEPQPKDDEHAGQPTAAESSATAETPSPAQEAGAAPAKQGVKISDKARKYFRAGVAYLQDPDGARYDEAYLEFKAAYADSPSPKILGNIGLCAMKIERIDEAIEAYTTYLKEVADIPEIQRKQIEQDLVALQASAVRVTITVNVPGVKLSDTRQPIRGFPVNNNYGPIQRSLELRVSPGRHRLVAKRKGYQDAEWLLNARPGDVHVHEFKLDKIVPAQPTEIGDVMPWVFIGLGIAAGGAASVTGAITLNKRSELRATCPDDQCPFASNLDEQRSAVKTHALATDILIGSAVASTLTGVLWLALDSGEEGKDGDKAATQEKSIGPRLQWSAGCGPYGCSGHARVDF